MFRPHWFHLLRHKAFWVSVLFMALYGGMEAVGLYRQGAEKLSDGLFAGLTFLGVVLAAFCSLYLGTEYQDGTLRNKVTAGYRREQIYFSCLLACLGGGLLIWGSYLAAYLAVGLPLLGGKMGDWALVGGSCLGTLLLLMVYVCLYTCLGELAPGQGHGCRRRYFAGLCHAVWRAVSLQPSGRASILS